MTSSIDLADAHAWTERLSSSFSAMASEIAAASQALAAQPPPRRASGYTSDTTSLEVDVAALGSRLEAIEARQEEMLREMEGIKDLLVGGAKVANGHAKEGETSERQDGGDDRLAALEKKLNDLADTVKLDQQRLYARLCNISIRHQTALVKAPATSNGKPPPNFPGTKGEFEHLTKERYEGLMKVYDIPVKGDTDTKRETVRQFLGLPGWTGAKANN
ncbi:hypothetical protein OE88DRAFT_1640084 [Heliocybe sulcata]|uniref:Uncharacterized protein n=1 Tax=Heliocybe sulcata TaxID=5364 RepID=A0A5C3MV75_9AGAM|nr:hypothetical protein OE88DRAFT_1640084 [Heliocybe sulcata]